MSYMHCVCPNPNVSSRGAFVKKIPYKYNFNSPPAYSIENPLDGRVIVVAATHECGLDDEYASSQRDDRRIVEIGHQLDIPFVPYEEKRPMRAYPGVNYREYGFILIGNRWVHKLDGDRVEHETRKQLETGYAITSIANNFYNLIKYVVTGNCFSDD